MIFKCEVKLDPYPLIKGHGEDKRKECECIQYTDEDEAVSDYFPPYFIEFIDKFLLLGLSFFPHWWQILLKHIY